MANTNNTEDAKKRNRKTRKRQRLDPCTSKICVVGAGLAGMSCALSLRRAGFRHIEVYERDTNLDVQKEGYGLTLTYNPKGPLSDLGVLETVAQHDCPSRSHYLFRQEEQKVYQSDRQPKEIDDERKCKDHDFKTKTNYAIPMGYFGSAFFDSSSTSPSSGQNKCRRHRRRGYGQRGNLRVPRKVLRKILYEKLLYTQQEQQQDNGNRNDDTIGNVAVHWNHSLVDYRFDESNHQYHLRFSNSGELVTTSADLLVAADGIRSSVLQQLYNSQIAEESIESQTTAPTPSLLPDMTTRIPPSLFSPSPSTSPPPSIWESPERYGLHRMGVRLILGIANDIDHPLLRERGFYTIDTKGHRLFTMPYHSNRFDFDSNHNTNYNSKRNTNDTNNNKGKDTEKTHKNRIMWQLSFSTDNNNTPSSLDSTSLREYVLRTFQSWHPPVLNLVLSTPIESIWGTDLMDRNPRRVYESLIVGRASRSESTCGKGQTRLQQPRLIVCGDALHSMSPFKGQGANQALAGGPLLAKWLIKSSIDAALTNWWRETLNRTVPIVESSRKAAQNWHNPTRILQLNSGRDRGGDEEYHNFAGVRSSDIPSLVDILRKRKIGPHLGGELDLKIRDTIREHGWFDDERNDNSDEVVNNEEEEEENHSSTKICEQVLRLASNGDTEGLRQMSLPSSLGSQHHQYCTAMVEAKDEEGKTCLHLAAMNNHRSTCHWLLVEIRVLKQWYHSHKFTSTNDDVSMKEVGCGAVDILGKTAYDYAIQTQDKRLIHIFKVVMNDEAIERQEKMQLIIK